MREIKFRAWDKERKEMREVELMDWSDWWVSTGSTGEREEPSKYGERNSFKNEQTDRHILMQYTGLKDKNGKEIYEGDVVNASWYDYDEPRDDAFGEVFFNGNWMAYCIWKEDEKSISEMNGQGAYHWEIEVVGNIYENPELLEQQ